MNFTPNHDIYVSDCRARSIRPKHDSFEIDSGQELHFFLARTRNQALCLERQADAQFQGSKTESLCWWLRWIGF